MERKKRMNHTRRLKTITAVASVAIVIACLCFLPACNKGKETQTPEGIPVFSLAWSEYPSWSVFGVAHEIGIINGKEGEMGPIEKKWGVDIALKEATYDACIVMYAAAQCDAACLTNMDVLNPSLRRRSVAILPTSTSFGADALIVDKNKIKEIKQLRGKNVYGLQKTVSEYCFARNLELRGEKEADHKFTNMDPGAAALAFQQKKTGYEAIVVWNPFVLETLNKRTDGMILEDENGKPFDSTMIPGEIVDMVQIAQTSLDKPGGKAFACAIIDTFYTVCRQIDDPKTHDATLIALGEKFSNLDLKSMETVVKQTLFYSTPEAGIKLLTGDEWATPHAGTKITGESFKKIMVRVLAFCESHEIVPKAPTIGYGDKKDAPDVLWRVDPSYVRAYQAGPQK